jgi:hypothetical protein
MRQATMVHAKHATTAYLRVMTEMTLLGLRVVLEVARQGSFSAAATALG